jgi:hypothetical protein
MNWRAWLAGVLLGAAGSMGSNLASNDIGWRGVIATLSAGAVLAGVGWMQGLPLRSPLARYTAPVLLAIAFVDAILTLVLPRHWVGPGALMAAGLVAVVILMSADLPTAIRLLGGAALVGVGVGMIGVWIMALRTGDVGLALMLIVIGAATLFVPETITMGVLGTGAGLGLVVFGVDILRSNAVTMGLMLLVSGMLLVAFGLTYILHAGTRLRAGANIGLGMVCVGLGVIIWRVDPLAAVGTIGMGVSAIGFGVTAARRGSPGGVVSVIMGLTLVVVGANFLRDDEVLLGVACTAGGLAVVAAGGMYLYVNHGRRMWSWLAGLTREPTKPEWADDGTYLDHGPMNSTSCTSTDPSIPDAPSG